MKVREFIESDLDQMIGIWNEIVDTGDVFPQNTTLDRQEGLSFFSDQTYTGVLESNGEIQGLYILHPNNVGRCSHIANASYAVKNGRRGKGVGEKLILHSLEMAKLNHFRILQFNAVTVTNAGAIHLYKRLGFTQLGIIPGGFLSKENKYIDIIPHYMDLTT